MSAYTHARTASDVHTQELLGLPEQNANPPPSPSIEGNFFGGSSDRAKGVVWKRKMGPAETSYYLPSRADGVNDMYLHLQLLVPAHLFVPSRVLLVWALLRLRHPLLGSTVEMNSHEDINFVFELPKSSAEAVIRAKAAASFPTGQTKADLVDAFLNGPRTLSNDVLAKLLISIPPSTPDSDQIFVNPASQTGITGDDNTHIDFMFFAGHFLGDGVSFAVIANEFLTLICNDMSEEDLAQLVQSEIDAYILKNANPIPVSTEQRLAIPRSWGKFQKAIGAVEFMNNQAKHIGGQVFPRKPPGSSRQTTVDTRIFGPKETATILKKCKSEGVTIAHAVFALVNVAWARKKVDPGMPLMLYSAINLRGALRPPKPTASSFFHLCVGYYNVVLPSFLIPALGDSKTFWLRCQSTKRQTLAAVKSKFLVTRAMAMSTFRERQALGWAKVDDAAEERKMKEEEAKKGESGGVLPSVTEKLVAGVESLKVSVEQAVPNGKGEESSKVTPTAPTLAPTASSTIPTALGLPKAPQAALMGVSFLGNLDAISNYTTYTSVHTSHLTFGARQRPGGMLMFAYTFAGRLWFSLGWDKNGFPEGVVEQFWDEVNGTVQEFLNVA